MCDQLDLVAILQTNFVCVGQSCKLGSLVLPKYLFSITQLLTPSLPSLHFAIRPSAAEYTFCQERDMFNGAQCCSGVDGDPSADNVCSEGKGRKESDWFVLGLQRRAEFLEFCSTKGRPCFRMAVSQKREQRT